MSDTLPVGGRILVVKLSSLGDLFHVLPAIHAVKQTYNLTVDWVTQPEYVDLVKCFTDVDKVYAFPRRSLVREWSAYRAQFAGEHYDAALDMQGLLKSALAGRVAKAPMYGHIENRDFAGWLYAKEVGSRQLSRHAVDRGLDMARHFGAFAEGGEAVFPVRFPVPALTVKPDAVGLVPCSRWPAKNWPVKEFVQAAKYIGKKVDAHFYVFGGPEDKAVCGELASALPGKAESLAGAYSLLESGGLLSKMKTVITVDSGPMHMAAAAGVPVVALFGVTDPGRTGPYGEMHSILMSDTFADGKNLARKFKHAPPEAWVLDPKRVALAAIRTLRPDRSYSVRDF
jgi:ADP-heptose:LPS heptosyltransferase